MPDAREFLHDKYRILSDIADGDLGPVFRARDVDSGAICAIHLIVIPAPENESALAALREEITKVPAHPNIVPPGDLLQTAGGQPFFVRELVEGQTLEQVVRSEAPLGLARACGIARQVALALEAAHHAGITHGDLKPSSVLLTKDEKGGETVKVLGVGMFPLKQRRFVEMARLAISDGSMFGTPEYISPEQAVGTSFAALDGRSDLYSLGVIWYEMLSGEPPFRGSAMEVLLGQLFAEPPSLQDRAELQLPETLNRLLMRTLAKRRDDRPASATALVDQLSAWEQPAPVSGPEPETAAAPPINEDLGLGVPPLAPAAASIDLHEFEQPMTPPATGEFARTEPSPLFQEQPSEEPSPSTEPVRGKAVPAAMLPPIELELFKPEPASAFPSESEGLATTPAGAGFDVSLEDREARASREESAESANESPAQIGEPAIAVSTDSRVGAPTGISFGRAVELRDPAPSAHAAPVLAPPIERQPAEEFTRGVAAARQIPEHEFAAARTSVEIPLEQPVTAAPPVSKMPGRSPADAVIFGGYVPPVIRPKASRTRYWLWSVAAVIVLVLIGCGWLYYTGRTYWFHPDFLKWRAASLFSASSPHDSQAKQPAVSPLAASSPPAASASGNSSAPGGGSAASAPAAGSTSQQTAAPTTIAPMQVNNNPPGASSQPAASSNLPAQAPVQSAANMPARAPQTKPAANTATPQQGPDSSVALVQQALKRGGYYFDRGQYDRAIRIYQDGLTKVPGDHMLVEAVARARRAKAAEAKFLGQ